MKWLIASDLHGSATWCRKLLALYEAEKADRFLLLGDILYHGPRNDLPEGYAPKEVIALLSPLAADILCVRGNCEAEVDQMVLPFPVMADYALLETASRLVFVTHGHVWNRDHLPPLHPGDVLLHGHTHVPACEPLPEGVLYLNPGSVAIPKAESPRSCMTLENGLFRWVNLENGEVYREWDLAADAGE
ncbi:MAG: phosphodiesterase [Clostridia bacterium]|nr:phosphodiesterase [Clostridia bacterium]